MELESNFFPQESDWRTATFTPPARVGDVVPPYAVGCRISGVSSSRLHQCPYSQTPVTVVCVVASDTGSMLCVSEVVGPEFCASPTLVPVSVLCALAGRGGLSPRPTPHAKERVGKAKNPGPRRGPITHITWTNLIFTTGLHTVYERGWQDRTETTTCRRACRWLLFSTCFGTPPLVQEEAGSEDSFMQSDHEVATEAGASPPDLRALVCGVSLPHRIVMPAGRALRCPSFVSGCKVVWSPRKYSVSARPFSNGWQQMREGLVGAGQGGTDCLRYLVRSHLSRQLVRQLGERCQVVWSLLRRFWSWATSSRNFWTGFSASALCLCRMQVVLGSVHFFLGAFDLEFRLGSTRSRFCLRCLCMAEFFLDVGQELLVAELLRHLLHRLQFRDLLSEFAPRRRCRTCQSSRPSWSRRFDVGVASRPAGARQFLLLVRQPLTLPAVLVREKILLAAQRTDPLVPSH